MGRVVGGDHVDGAVQHALHQRVPVGLVPQGRVHLEPALILQVILAQKQVVGPGLAGHIHTLSLGLADQRHRFLAAHMAYMVAAAGFPGQAEIPLNGPPLALRGNAGDAVGMGVGPVVNRAAGRNQAHVLTVGRDEAPGSLAADHGLAHGFLVLHAPAIVGEACYPGRQGCHVRQFALALLPQGDGAVGRDADDRVPGDDFLLRPQMLVAVGGGIQVGHSAHLGVAATGAGHRPRADGLLIRKTRLTQMHVHIHETGKNSKAVQFKNMIRAFSGKPAATGGDNTVLHHQIHGKQPALVIHQAALEQHAHAAPSSHVVIRVIIADFRGNCNRRGEFSSKCIDKASRFHYDNDSKCNS